MADPLHEQLLHGPEARWPQPRRHGGLVLPLSSPALAALPDRLAVDGSPWPRKDEFHLTLLNAAQWASVQRAHALPTVQAAFARLDWKVRADGRYWLVRSPEHAGRTVIATVDAPALAAFRCALATPTFALEAPRPHLTLYWAGAARGGIGLSGPQQWAERVLGELAIDWQATPLPHAILR
jgi:hypothetical protein